MEVACLYAQNMPEVQLKTGQGKYNMTTKLNTFSSLRVKKEQKLHKWVNTRTDWRTGQERAEILAGKHPVNPVRFSLCVPLPKQTRTACTVYLHRRKRNECKGPEFGWDPTLRGMLDCRACGGNLRQDSGIYCSTQLTSLVIVGCPYKHVFKRFSPSESSWKTLDLLTIIFIDFKHHLTQTSKARTRITPKILAHI